MGWREDTIYMISDVLEGRTSTITVKSATIDISAKPPIASGATDVYSGTVTIQNMRGNYRFESKGLVKESTHMIFFPFTSTVDVGHRIFESANSDYYLVLNVDDFEDHKEIDAQLVVKR